MEAFLQRVAQDVWDKYPDNQSDIVFVVAGKRVALFLRKYYAQRCEKTMYSPEFVTIEDLVEKISGLRKMPNIHLLFELYQTYCSLSKDNADPFEVFISWGQTLLQDFNEIDQYLIEPNKIFPYVKAIKEVEHWSGADSLTDLQKKHLVFWETLGLYYEAFREKLLKNGWGYNGLIYREASQKIDDYISQNKNKIHVFVGLNVLSASQEKMIQAILEALPSQVYWDTDKAFIQEPSHDAAMFIRSYIQSWKYFEQNPPQWIDQNFEQEKKISIIGVSKKENQAQKVAQVVREKKLSSDIDKTAIVLADESLLIPVVNAIDVDCPLNITMGYPLSQLPLSEVFTMFFKLYFFSQWYHKDLMSFLTHPYVHCFFQEDTVELLDQEIQNKNWVYIKRERLLEVLSKISKQDAALFAKLLPDINNDTANMLINSSIDYLLSLKSLFINHQQEHKIVLEQASRFYQLFNQLKDLQSRYGYLQTPKSLYLLFLNLLQQQTLDFRGEPLQGLQLMGVLESRNLDFEHVILVSVNEGVLPKGKGGTSFIPYDVKRYLGLPTYQQKDAVYSYYFYRLLQRSKHIHIIYNTDTEVLGSGEKSRFVVQLESFKSKNHNIEHSIEMPELKIEPSQSVVISKTDDLCLQLEKMAEKGFSPSALANYIRNPLIFYKQNVMGIHQDRSVEETIDARTFGDIIHHVLESLYLPYVEKVLTENDISQMQKRVRDVVLEKFFEKFEKDGSVGKNTLMIEVFVEYINRFLLYQKSEIQSYQSIEILQLEKRFEVPFTLKTGKTVLLKGFIDRIDRRDGQIYIIDYKTGRVTPQDLSVSLWDNIIKETKYSKAFQLLMYAYIYTRIHPDELPVQVGNYSLKNLSSGFLPFVLKDKQFEASALGVDATIMQLYEEALDRLITEIFNRDIPFHDTGES